MKIKKKLVAIGLGAMLCLGMTGCQSNSQIIDTSADANVNDYGTYEWVSPDGVHYWVYCGYYRYGIAPRYDSNGELVIDK